MLTPEQRLRIYGGPKGVARVEKYIADLVAAAPPLTPEQRDRLRVLFAPTPDTRQPAA